MGHINFDKGTKKKHGFSGFYLALAICLVAVGGVAVTSFVSSFGGIGKRTESTTGTTTPTKPVGQVVSDVPDTRSTTKKTTTEAPTTAATTEQADLFILPLTNEVIREFSNGSPVFNSTMNDWRVHNGVDFKGAAGQSVKALADGTVTKIITKDLRWGDILVIDHGYGIQSRYCGVKADSVKANQAVKVGDVIGALAEVPCESEDGPHLHLEVLVNEEYVNPVEAIGREVKYPTTAAAATTATTTTKATSTKAATTKGTATTATSTKPATTKGTTAKAS